LTQNPIEGFKPRFIEAVGYAHQAQFPHVPNESPLNVQHGVAHLLNRHLAHHFVCFLVDLVDVLLCHFTAPFRPTTTFRPTCRHPSRAHLSPVDSDRAHALCRAAASFHDPALPASTLLRFRAP
jgi:hypothetical protein